MPTTYPLSRGLGLATRNSFNAHARKNKHLMKIMENLIIYWLYSCIFFDFMNRKLYIYIYTYIHTIISKRIERQAVHTHTCQVHTHVSGTKIDVARPQATYTGLSVSQEWPIHLPTTEQRKNETYKFLIQENSWHSRVTVNGRHHRYVYSMYSHPDKNKSTFTFWMGFQGLLILRESGEYILKAPTYRLSILCIRIGSMIFKIID